MRDQDKTKGQLIDELGELRQRIVELESSEAEHERAKEALRESEERYRRFIEASPDAIAISNLEGNITFVSPVALTLFGGESENDVSGTSVLEWIIPEEHEKAIENIGIVLKGGSPPDSQYTLLAIDGTRFFGEINSSLLQDADGNPTGMISIIRDVTDRKRAEKLIRIQRDLSVALSAAPKLDQTLHLCTDTAIRVSGMDCGGVYLVDEASGDVDLAFHQGLPADLVEHASHYDADSANARLVMAGEPLYTRHHKLDTPLDEHVRHEGLRALAIIPVHYEDRVIACLNIASHTLDEVPDSVRTALEMVATQIGSAIAHSKAQEALRESERFLQGVFDAIQDGISVLDRDLTIIHTNQWMEKMYAAHLPLVGKKCYEVYQQRQSPCPWCPSLPTIETGEVHTEIVPYPSAEKPTGWIELSAFPLKSINGSMVSVIEHVKDITERKQAEEALRESEERFRQMAENSRDMFWLRDLKSGELIYITPAHERIWGRSVEDAYPKPTSWIQDVHPEDRERVTAAVMEQAQGKPTENEYRIVWPDGSIHWIRDRVSPICDEAGEAYRVVGVVEDITERKQAEEALHTEKDFTDTALDAQSDTFFLFEPATGKALRWNKAFRDISGYTDEEIARMPAPTSYYSPQDLERATAFIQQVLEEGVGTIELELICKDGRQVATEYRVSVINDDRGEPKHMISIGRDITRRKRAEEALRESEEKYRTLVEQSLQGLLVVQDLHIIFANTAFSEICGYSVEELLSLAPEDVVAMIHSEDQALVLEHYQDRLMGKPTPPRYEYRGIRKDGAVRWLEMSSNRIEYQGKPAVQAAIVDITERKQAEEKLQESERKFRTFTESAPVGILIYQGYQCVYANPGAEQITGYTDKELSSMAFWELVHPDHRNAVIEGGKALERGELPVSESQVKIVAKNGEERWIDGRLEVIEYEGKRAVLISALDITDRMQAEQERERLLAQIREQAQRMQHILDTVPEGVLLLDADERIILVNPVAGRELVNLSDAQTGDTLTRLGDRPLAELLTSPPRGLWHEVTANDRSFQVIARPVENGPVPTGWVLVIRDVTQQRRIEQRVQQQERLAAVGQLAAGIAHDFNNIMAAIVLYAQMTTQMEGLPAVVRERMETIDQQAKHATRLIQQILDFGRQAMLERRPLDLVPLLKEHVTLLKRTLPESIEISLDCEPDEYATPFTVNADPTRMQQMVTNLALNAREAMPRGGQLCIRLEQITVRPKESPLLPEMAPGEWVRLTMSDTGTGIPPDVLPHIFEPFFTTRAPLGSGLGLAQVHGIVGQHGGRIDVDTQVGKGTTFTIYLPIYSSKPSSVPTVTDLPALPQGQEETILVVEDDAVVRKALADSLELLNYRVLAVANGQEALEMLKQRRGEVALVLSDVVMPQMGGVALLHTLKEQGLAVPVVMLTGHPIERRMEELRAQGMADWLPKPPQLEQLAKVVAQALSTD